MNATTRKIVTINNVCQEKTSTFPKADWTMQCHFHWAGAKHFGNLPLTLNTGDLSRCGSECS